MPGSKSKRKKRNLDSAPLAQEPAGAIPAAQNCSSLLVRVRRLLPAFATGLVFCWLALANLAPIIGNDIHTQIRVGADILRSGHVPEIETYSATAAGRPFIAHEWLASVIFYGLDVIGGTKALCLLQVALALACAALLWLSIAASVRGTLFVLPLLLLCSYVLAWRAAVRPHLFSLAALCGMVFLIERWRTSGNWRILVWLVPMQVVWINLHGEAPLGPAIVLLMALGAAILTWMVKPAPPAALRPWKKAEIRPLLAISFAMGLACLANPNGWRIFPFAGRLLATDAYIHRLVWEWRAPLANSELERTAFWIWCAFLLLLALMWTGLAFRLFAGRRKMDVLVLDLLLASFATALSLQANRFVAYAALFGFPVIARSLQHASELLFANKPLRRHPLIEIAIAGMLIYGLLSGGGLPAGRDRVRDRRPVGWGYGENTPFEEVTFIRQKGFEGAIYNEYSDGALIIRELAPKVRPVIDSRIDVYGEALSDEYFRSATSAAQFREYLRKYDVKLVLCDLSEANRGLYELLRKDAEWTRVLQTRYRFLFARADMLAALPHQ